MANYRPLGTRVERTKDLSIPVTEEDLENINGATSDMLKPPDPIEEHPYDSSIEGSPMQTTLVRASHQGDSIRVAKLLHSNPDIDVSSTDALGRSALRMAVKMDHLEVVETLINRASPPRLVEALLLSIALGHDEISEAIIQHKVYKQCKHAMKVCTLPKRSRVVESVLKTTTDDTLFSSDITPLILAAQKNQFEIVRLLLSQVETIREPCPLDCDCISCHGSRRDELRYSATRLNTYKALASEAYISIQSKDPLLRAFEMANKLRQNSKHEGYFRSQYLVLAANLSNYCVKLLDKVRDGRELEEVLDGEHGQLSRLGLAIQYKEKQFVTHPSCQKKLSSVWVGGVHFLNHSKSCWKMILFAVGLIICYPFLAVCYLIYPWNKIGKLLTVPVVKFTSMACSYVVFVLLAIVHSLTERPFLPLDNSSRGTRLTELTLLQNNSVTVERLFNVYLRNCAGTNFSIINDVYIRNARMEYCTWVMILWVAGFIWQSCKRIYHEGICHFLSSWYNRADIFMQMAFVSAFTLRIIGKKKTSRAIAFFQDENTWQNLSSIGCVQNSSQVNYRYREALYLINAERQTWTTWDIYIVFEALQALGNILAVCRLTFIFALHPRIGPLIKSLSRMIRDVFQFMFIFALVVFGFFMGFNTLFWYHSSHEKTGDFEKIVHASETFDVILWSIFGMVDKSAVRFLQKETIDSDVTRSLGFILFGLYNWVTVIVLITMLIAMMARSYDSIADDADVQWKFSRSSLYMDFINQCSTLCVPFNVIPCTKHIVYLLQRIPKLAVKSKPNIQMKDEWRRRPDSQVCDSPAPLDSPDLHTKGDVIELSQITHSLSSAFHTEESPVQTPYEFTMKCILERFIAQVTNKTEKMGNKDKEKDSLSKEISNIHTEICNSVKLQNHHINQLDEKLTRINTILSKLTGKSNSTS